MYMTEESDDSENPNEHKIHWRSKSGIPLEVRVLHEASNRYDSAVQVFLDYSKKWNRIGYLVREVVSTERTKRQNCFTEVNG